MSGVMSRRALPANNPNRTRSQKTGAIINPGAPPPPSMQGVRRPGLPPRGAFADSEVRPPGMRPLPVGMQPPASQINPTRPTGMGFPTPPEPGMRQPLGGQLGYQTMPSVMRLSPSQAAEIQRRMDMETQSSYPAPRLNQVPNQMPQMSLPPGNMPRPGGGLGSVGPMPGGGGMGPGLMGPRPLSSVNTTTDADMMGGRQQPGTSFANIANAMRLSAQSDGTPGGSGMTTQSGLGTGAPSAFRKGGMVKAAPVKKKAGGAIAKPKAAPTKMKKGGAVAKPKAKPMPAFKKGGKVAMKGKK